MSVKHGKMDRANTLNDAKRLRECVEAIKATRGAIAIENVRLIGSRKASRSGPGHRCISDLSAAEVLAAWCSTGIFLLKV